MKLSKKKIENIRKLRKEGFKIREIAERLNVCTETVMYWTNEHYRQKQLKRMYKIEMKLYREGKQWNQKNLDKRKEFMREYMKRRYHTEPEFRRKMLQSSLKYQKKMREKKQEVLG